MMMNITKRFIQKINGIQQANKYKYFKENISQIFQKQSQSNYSIRDINSLKDSRIFSQESQKISEYLNDFTQVLYDKQDIINPIKIKQEYQQNECELIADILENRMMFISQKIQKIKQELDNNSNNFSQYTAQYQQLMILVLDLFNFSILCCAFNQYLNTTFSAIMNDWMGPFTKLIKNNNISVDEQLLVSISRIFQSATNNPNISLEQLQFDIFSFTQFLTKALQKQKQYQQLNQIEDKKDQNQIDDQVELLDIQIELLYNIKKLWNMKGNQINRVDSVKEFRQQFKQNQFYDFWINLDNNDEDNTEQLQTGEIEHVQKSKLDNLFDYLQDDVFDSVLLKRSIRDPKLLIKLLEIYPSNKLSEIPSQNFVQLIEKHIQDKESVIKFMEIATSKNLYNSQLSQKLAFYNDFYNLITSTYISSLDSYLNTNSFYNSFSHSKQTELSEQQNKLFLSNIADIFKIMDKSNVVDFQFLKLLEALLNQNNQIQKLKHPEFIKILHFFGNFPLKMETLTKNQINYYLDKQFVKMKNQQKIECSVNLLKLENQPDSPLYMLVQRPLFCTLENMSQITDFIIQFNSQPNKTLQEKIQFYFLTKTFFKDQIKISKHFEEQLNDLKEAFQKAGFSKISQFQKQILTDLIYQDQKENPKSPNLKQFQSELFLEDVFSIDYLINDKTILEVNGPTHYFMVNRIPANYKQQYDDKLEEIDTFEDDVNFNLYSLIQNRNTTIKSVILSKLYSYKVKQIPFLTYQKQKFLNKHTQLVYEITFSNTPLRDLLKII